MAEERTIPPRDVSKPTENGANLAYGDDMPAERAAYDARYEPKDKKPETISDAP
jgi:hypothetical protein